MSTGNSDPNYALHTYGINHISIDKRESISHITNYDFYSTAVNYLFKCN